MRPHPGVLLQSRSRRRRDQGRPAAAAQPPRSRRSASSSTTSMSLMTSGPASRPARQGSFPGTGIAMILPRVSTNVLSGLMEAIAADPYGGRADLPHLARACRWRSTICFRSPRRCSSCALHGGRADLPHLATSLQMEVDDLFPVAETLQLLRAMWMWGLLTAVPSIPCFASSCAWTGTNDAAAQMPKINVMLLIRSPRRRAPARLVEFQ